MADTMLDLCAEAYLKDGLNPQGQPMLGPVAFAARLTCRRGAGRRTGQLLWIAKTAQGKVLDLWWTEA